MTFLSYRPGHVDFSVEVELATRVLDGCVVLIDAVAGVQCQTKSVWRRLNRRNLPAVAFVNKMDRIGASIESAMSSMAQQLQTTPLAMQMPVFVRSGQDDRFAGFVDLLTRTKFEWPATTSSQTAPAVSTVDAYDAAFEEVERGRVALLEQLASHDDEFMELYLEQDQAVPIDAVLQALRRATLSRRLLPVFCGATLKGMGTQALLDGVTALLPSPLDVQLPSATDKGGKTPVELETALMIFKLSQQGGRGLVAFGRLFAGRLQSGAALRNLRVDQEDKVNALLTVDADEFAAANEKTALPGEVVCLSGLRAAAPGDLLVSRRDAVQLNRHAALRAQWMRRASVEIPPPVFALALETESSSHVAALEKALVVLLAEDPSLAVDKDAETGQLILRGLGELHLEVAVDKLRRQHRVPVSTGQTHIACRETLQLGRELDAAHLLSCVSERATLGDDDGDGDAGADVAAAEEAATVMRHAARYERVLEGGKRLFAAFDLEVAPLPAHRISAPAQFVVDDAVKAQLSMAERDVLADALRRSFERGPRGYPVTGLCVRVLSVERDANTTPGAIRACVSTALSQLLSAQAGQVEGADVPVLLEPVMLLEVTAPPACLGSIVSDLTSNRRALQVQLRSADDEANGDIVVEAVAPLRSILGYASSLRSLTKGEGSFTAEYLAHLPMD